MLWLSRKDIEHISRRLLRDYLKKVPQKVDHIDPADFAEKMCGLQFTFADISEAHDAIGLTATSGVIIIDLLEGGPEFLDSFDAELFGELVEKIIIESNDSVRFCLKNGLELRESIERTVR